jgi:hypothetical protein
MDSNSDTSRSRLRLKAVKEIGKMLLNLKSRGFATTVLRESRVSAAGWPDFFVSGRDGRIACLSVCLDDGTDDAGGQLWSTEEMPGSLPHLAVRLREVQQSWKAAHPDVTAGPSLMILCSHWPEAALRRKWPGMDPGGVLLVPKESCQASRLPEALERLPGSSASDPEITLLRAFLAPETILQPPLSPVERRQQSRAQQLSLLPQLLDYDQDHCAKIDLWLSDEGRDTAENFGVRLVTGAAGTGKSVVLVHRAALLRQFQPQAKIAVLTHNRALCTDLESRYQRMSGSGGVEFRTFYSWLGKQYPAPARIVSDEERDAFLPPASFDQTFLRDEFDWIHDQGLESLEDYLAAPRTGRTLALRESQRRAVHTLLVEYRRRLDAANATDWSLRAAAALKQIPRGPLYDFILIDEAQFFARSWFRLIRQALRPGGQMFLCADPAQGFLGRGQSWREAGLEVKGRSMVLKRPYRNTRQILSFAAARYEQYVLDDEEAPRLQETIQPYTALRDGPEPAEITVTSPQEEINAVVRQAQQLVTGGTPAGDILILCARRRQVQEILTRLHAAALSVLDISALTPVREDKITVGTFDKATGLERPIVVLCGLREFSNHEQNPALPADERRRHRRLNASRLYMACTRAIQRLVIVSCAFAGSAPGEK